jgi:hypothetical protein
MTNLINPRVSNAIRHYSTCTDMHAQKQPVVVIAGAGAKTARVPIAMMLSRGFNVIALTGQDMKEKADGLHFKKIDRKKLTNPKYISASIREAMEEMGVATSCHIMGLNLIGTAIAPKGSTLMEVNHDIPLSFFEGLLEASEGKTDRVSLSQLSSITITINGDTDCPYIHSKKKIEESLFQLNPKGTVLSLRPGMICPAPDQQCDTTHDYSVEQLARLPIIPILGSGNQIMQPVSEDCLYTAMINGMLSDQVTREIINTVGSDTLTQKELFAYFAPKQNPIFVHIPANFGHVVAEHFPKGRIAPYAVGIFDELDKKPEKNLPVCGERFTELLGKKPIGMKELYKDATIVTRNAPIGEHIGEMVMSPKKALKVGFAAVKSAKDVYFSKHNTE